MLNLCEFGELVYTIAEMENESKLWDIYIALVSNPYAEVGSFEEFKHKNKPKPKVNLEATVKNSFEVLQNFNPTNEGVKYERNI